MFFIHYLPIYLSIHIYLVIYLFIGWCVLEPNHIASYFHILVQNILIMYNLPIVNKWLQAETDYITLVFIMLDYTVKLTLRTLFIHSRLHNLCYFCLHFK